MSAGKGDKPRSCFSKEFKENYDKVFRKPDLPPVKIFFDLDECVLHSMWHKEDLAECIGGIDDFIFEIDREQYRTVIRPGARECIKYARKQVGTENVYVLTASTKEYSNTINETAKLGFKTEQIYHRADISEVYRDKDKSVPKYPDFRPCVIIDNLSYNDNQGKAYFLRIWTEDYQQVKEFRNDEVDGTEFIEKVCAFIDNRIRFYSKPENRE